jgi:phenylpropionate dioxygenase-like ring-hydroxylating dioxygenase large terminal subunit
MSSPSVSKQPDIAYCPRAPSTQEIIHRDGKPVPPVLALESYRFLGDGDLPFENYTSPDFFQKEMDSLWSRVWQWVCREEQIPHVGDYVTYEIGRRSFLVVRTAERTIKAYYNSCLHRGTKLRATGAQGSAQELRCPYHGWTWTLDGELKRVPCSWDLPHVAAEEFCLPQARIDIWGGFVFLNMDPDAPSLRSFLGVMPEHFKNWHMENRFIEVHIEKELFANWKAAKEAFMENYHTQEAHPQLLAGNGDEMTQYDIFGDHVSRFLATNGVSSPHLDKPLSERQLLDLMLVGDRSFLDDELRMQEGETARMVMARFLRKSMGERYQCDLSRYSDTEMLDVIEYQLFPNMVLFPGISISIVYRFRPIGMDPDRSLFEVMVLRPVPDKGSRPEPARPFRLREQDSFTTVPGFDPAFGGIFDQDTGILRSQQEGFYAAKKRGQTLTNRQEVCVRHLESTVSKYVNGLQVNP